jgi:tetratricopeptide (TPR) repeat protein
MVRQRQYQEAVKVLEDALAHHPNDKDAQFLFFRILVLTADIKRARPLGLKLLTGFPHNADILYLNGVVDRSLGDYPLSKKHLEESVKIEPNHANARYNLGIVLVLLKEWPEAKEQLEQSIALGAIEPQAHFELAKALQALGETQRAQEESQKYQQLKKAGDDAIEAASKAAQGDEDLAGGKVQDAIARYREASEISPNFGGYKYKLSVALDRAGDTDGEKAQLEAAVALDPRLATAQNQLGYLLSRSGDVAGAEEHFRMAVRSAPGWTEAWINFAAILAGEAHIAEAKDAVAIALRLEPQNAQARELSDQLARDPAGQQAHP